MKKTVSTATALSTAIVIALGGIALSGQAASAASVPGSVEAQVATASPRSVGEPQDGQGSTEQPVATAGPSAEPVDQAAPVEGAAPVDEAAPVDDGAPLAAQAEAFSLVSPVEGAVYPTLGYELVIDTTEDSIAVVVYDGAGQPIVNEPTVAGPRMTQTIYLPDEAPADQAITVVVSDARGALLGYETRNFRIDVPTSPAVTVSTPRTGAIVTADSEYPGLGVFAIAGTGVPGSAIAFTVEALSGQEGWGHDYDPPRVGADGTYRFLEVLPHGSWRLLVSQYVPRGDGLAGLEGPPFSRMSVPVVVEFALVAPAATAPEVPPVAPAVIPVVSRPVNPVGVDVVPVAHRSDLAYTGSSETTPWAGLAGMVLVGLGAATVLVTRRRASRG